MAKDFLAIMATSAPIEREFSKFGNIITKNRNQMTKQMGRMIMCLKSWKIPEIIVEEPDSDSEDPDSDSNSDKE
jgi:hypothetical protein